MPTIDLGSPPPKATDVLDGLPRRVALSLAELRLVAEHAGGAPLPFDVAERAPTSALDGRLGQSRGAADDEAYAAALAGLHDPATSLARRGLLLGGTDGAVVVDPGLVGAVGLLATPAAAVDIDVTAGGVQAKAWHRQSGDAVAALGTVDGIIFELAWFPSSSWPAELARVAAIPEDLALRDSAVPADVDLPFELVDAANEAIRAHRGDLVPVLTAQHSGSVSDARGTTYSETEVATLLTALNGEAAGRLRVLVADVSGESTTTVGVVSWVLVADGWRALRPHRSSDATGSLRVAVCKVAAEDLAAELAPVLAEVSA